MEPIPTIRDLELASPERVDYWLRQVTLREDIEKYLYWLSSSEQTVTVSTKLKRYRIRSKGIHPSSACKIGVCPLSLYFGCTHEVLPKRSYCQESQLTWDVGTLLHDTWQTHLENMYGEQFRKEVSLSDRKWLISSHTDGIFSFSELRFVLEMKSIKEGGSFGWEKVQQKPMDDNVRQAHFYMKLSDIPFANILYLNKNKGVFKEHPIAFDLNIWRDIESNVLLPTVTAVQTKTPPQGKPGFGCRNCDYEHGCPAVREEKSKKDKAHAETISRAWTRRTRAPS